MTPRSRMQWARIAGVLAGAALLLPVVSFAETVSFGLTADGAARVDSNYPSSNLPFAVQFTPSQNEASEVLTLSIANFNASDNVIFELESDSGGSPSGTVLATQTVPASSLVVDSNGYCSDQFSDVFTVPDFGVSLSAGVQYWLVVDRSSYSMSNYTSLCTDSSVSTMYETGGSGWYGGNSAFVGSLAMVAPVVPVAPGSPFDEVFGSATSTASSTIAIVDMPTLDVFLAWTIFMSMAYFTVWLFRKST